MDFRDTPAEAAFRTQVRAFIRENLPADDPAGDDGPPGRFRGLAGWRKKLVEQRWVAPAWPPEYGGGGMPVMQQFILNEEMAEAQAPSVGGLGVSMAGPTIITHGTEDQKQEHLPRILSGEGFWCQGFSEPGAGSDLASVRTRARREGDEWVVTGQKVWSSGAHFSKRGILLARTDTTVPKHDGITFFLLDMDTPGVTVRPLRQVTGEAHFNEVFLDEVRIPDCDRVGEPGDGWSVAVTTIMHERMTLGGSLGVFKMDDLMDHARACGPLDRVVRDRIAHVYSLDRCLEFLNARMISKLGAGQIPTAEGSIAKLCASRLFTEAADVALCMSGPAAVVDDGPWQRLFLIAPGIHVGGGTDEVQRNAVAERVLGLPREADESRTLPFDRLYSG